MSAPRRWVLPTKSTALKNREKKSRRLSNSPIPTPSSYACCVTTNDPWNMSSSSPRSWNTRLAAAHLSTHPPNSTASHWLRRDRCISEQSVGDRISGKSIQNRQQSVSYSRSAQKSAKSKLLAASHNDPDWINMMKWVNWATITGEWRMSGREDTTSLLTIGGTVVNGDAIADTSSQTLALEMIWNGTVKM